MLDTARQSLVKAVVGVRSTKEKETQLLHLINSNFQASFDSGATMGLAVSSLPRSLWVCSFVSLNALVCPGSRSHRDWSHHAERDFPQEAQLPSSSWIRPGRASVLVRALLSSSSFEQHDTGAENRATPARSLPSTAFCPPPTKAALEVRRRQRA